MKTISLTFDGYWREVRFSSIPAFSGVYAFQECTYDPVSKTVSLKRILYIGQAVNCRERIQRHELLVNMNRYIAYGNVLCVNVANVSGANKDIAEAALIYKHQPPFNTLLKDSFDYESTTINNSGNHSLLLSSFTVYKTQKSLYPW